jgi:hypothetical protein
MLEPHSIARGLDRSGPTYNLRQHRIAEALPGCFGLPDASDLCSDLARSRNGQTLSDGECLRRDDVLECVIRRTGELPFTEGESMRGPRTALCVSADRVALVRGIRALQAAERLESQRATVRFRAGRLTIVFGEMTVSAEASETWTAK